MFTSFFQKICKSRDPVVRQNAVYNLPCFFYYFGNNEADPELDLVEIYCEFAQDDSKDIKMILGRGIHEAITLTEKAGKSPLLLGECF